jgi:hypothetical protein
MTQEAEFPEFAEIKKKLKTGNSFKVLDLTIKDLTTENGSLMNEKDSIKVLSKKCRHIKKLYHSDHYGNTGENKGAAIKNTVNNIFIEIEKHCNKLEEILKLKNDKNKKIKMFMEYNKNNSDNLDTLEEAVKKIGINAAVVGASYIGYKWLTKRSRQKSRSSSTEKSTSSQRSQRSKGSQRYQGSRRSQRSKGSQRSQSSFTPSKR